MSEGTDILDRPTAPAPCRRLRATVAGLLAAVGAAVLLDAAAARGAGDAVGRPGTDGVVIWQLPEGGTDGVVIWRAPDGGAEGADGAVVRGVGTVR